MSIAQLFEDVIPVRAERDSRGRFVRGNRTSAAGGRGRAAALSRRRRRAIARKGYRAMIRRHWGGDGRAQRKYWAEMGVHQYDRQCGPRLRPLGSDPGPVQEWRARYYTGDLLAGEWRDVAFWGVRDGE